MSKQRKHAKAKNVGMGQGGSYSVTFQRGKRAKTLKSETGTAEKIVTNPLYFLIYTGIVLAGMWALKHFIFK